jgi:hypothetical protein
MAIAWMRHINSKAHAFLDVPREIRDVHALCGTSRLGDRDWGETNSQDRCAKCVRLDHSMRRKAAWRP